MMQKTITILFCISFIAFVISCRKEMELASPPPNKYKLRWFDDIRLQEYPDIANERDIGLLLSIIKEEGSFQEYWIGSSASYPRQYAAVERLNQIASNELLLSLLRDKSAKVRVYTLRCLATRDYGQFDEEKQLLKKDSSEIIWRYGCKQFEVNVEWMIEHDYALEWSPIISTAN